MGFQENLAEFLDIEQGFAVRATVTPANGLAYEIRGIFVSDYYSIEAGFAGVAGEKITFEGIEKEMKEILYGDLLIVSGVKYQVTAIKPDGTGWVILALEKQE